MKLIVITTPHFFEGEAEAISDLFRAGLEVLHLRKPQASAEAVEQLLRQLPAEYMSRIVTHEYFSLAPLWGLKGIHLNSRNPQIPDNYIGHISCSCHSLNEVVQHRNNCSYVFLSPIYDSISKEGYASGYSLETLQQAHNEGIIDAHVMALGGICLDNLTQVKALGFGGAILLGDVWRHQSEALTAHFLKLKQTITD